MAPPPQVIVEKVNGARIPDLDRKKYLVPGDLTGTSLPPWVGVVGQHVRT